MTPRCQPAVQPHGIPRCPLFLSNIQANTPALQAALSRAVRERGPASRSNGETLNNRFQNCFRGTTKTTAHCNREESETPRGTGHQERAEPGEGDREGLCCPAPALPAVPYGAAQPGGRRRHRLGPGDANTAGPLQRQPCRQRNEHAASSGALPAPSAAPAPAGAA